MSRETTQARGAGSPGGEVGIPPPGYRLPATTRLGPVRLRVADRARSEAFYGRTLGLVRRDHGDGRTTLGAPEGDTPLIELVEVPGAAPVAPRSRIGLFHFALRVPERAALARLLLHLREMEIRVGTADHDVSEALYLTDPDGLGVEVYADHPRSRWRSRGRQLVMTTEPLDVADLVAEAGSEAFDGLPRRTDVGHVHLHVGDLDRASRFYHEALGFDKVVWDYPGALFLSAAGYHHHVGLNTWAGEAPPAGPDDAGLLSWTLVLPGVEDVESVTASLETSGVAVRREGSHDGGVALDPWGTAVELIAGSDLVS